MKKTELISLDDYVDSPYNPRIMFKEGDPVFESLSRSIDEFDCLQPLIVNKRTGYIISGHLRKRVLKSKGIDKAEAYVVDYDIIKERTAVIVFNKISGEWDPEKLANALDELSRIPDFDVSITGFEKVELSQALDRYRDIPDDNSDFDKEASLITKPVTKKEDRLILGRHVLDCGDSADPKVIARLMRNEKGNLLVTDPPYGCRYLQNRPDRQRSKKLRRWKPIYKDDLSGPEYEKWLRQVLTNIEPYLLPGAPFYIWNGFRQFPHMLQTLEGINFQISCVIVWVKERFAISYGDFHQGGEYAIYGWKNLEKGRHPWYGGANQSTIWQIRRDASATYEHPTQKPVELFARSIRNSSKRDDIIVDLFAGSGTAILASEALNRRCFAIEHEPSYCDVIVRRFIKYAPDKVSEEIKKRYLTEASHA